ncbi:polymeric immunoglobulin receptor isoform X2 [Astyanax mexicanus]|uniref:polymeric immunoglobulin receptor isoform X2 n=1 Tax=Astyanax mexicanus TaxID=7994 RepID=UPI0020CAA0A0|nr:polymeric immunoglobulin receptor isoform X2 [Astyanax mexicanus]
MLLWVYLLYCVLHEISGCSVPRGMRGPITKSVGDSVVLPCSCEDLQHNPNTLMWGYTKRIALGNYNAEHSVFPEDREQSQRYRGRFQRLTQNPPGDLSLIISHLTEEDEGLYLCGINGKYTTAVPLYIRGCSVINDGGNSLIKSPGESVLLPCFCPEEKKINPQRVTWFFSKPGSADKISVSNETQSYSGRVWMFDQPKSRNFSFLISDLNKDDSGEYRCRADEKYRPYVTLEVKGCTLSENKQTVPIIRSSGESVLLSCSCTDLQDSPERVQWRTPDHEDLFSTELHQRYRDRVQTFKQNSPGNLSVLISDLTVEDGGTYSCWINQNQHRTFSLTVKDCTLSSSQEKQIVRYPGESVLLPCSCSDPQTRPVSIKWEHVDSGLMEVSNRTGRYAGRIHMFNEKHPANLSLLLSNLTEQDNGLYRCTINNEKSISMKLNVKDCTLSNSQEKLIVGYSGEFVLLSCSCTDPQTRPVSIKWEHVDSDVMEVSNITRRYAGRIHMFNEKHPANLSLLLSNLTEQDEGLYRCTINNEKSISVNLTVKGCTLSNSQENQIVRYPGESVLLPCSCTDPQTRPVSIKWEHVDSNGTEVSNITERYAGRIHMFNEKHPANLSLLLFNLTKQDNGTYRCTINNEKSISMKLNVKDCTLSSSQETPIVGQPGNTTFEMNWTYWTPILSCVFLILLLLLGAAAYIFCKHRKGKRRSGKETEQRGNKEDDITYSSIAHGKKAKPPNTEDNITYASIAHGKKAKPPKTEDDVIYSSVVHDKKAKPTQRQAEEDVTYADVAFRRKSKKAEKQNNVTFSSEACKSERDTEEPTVYASVKTTKK